MLENSPKPIIAIANQKGGVGKTTVAINLAAGMATRGRRILLVDLDIQGSASSILCHPTDTSRERSTGDIASCLLEGRPIADAIATTTQHGLDLAKAGPRMASVDLHLATAPAREHALTRALNHPVISSYDLVILDTSPYLGLLTINAIVACSHIIVPVTCEFLPMLGLKLLRETLAFAKEQFHANAEILGYILTMVDRRERITDEVDAMLRETFGTKVFDGGIRVNTHHKASPSHHQTIYQYEPKGGKGRQDFDQLCDEVERRLSLREVRSKEKP